MEYTPDFPCPLLQHSCLILIKNTKCTIFEINWFIKMSESFSRQPPKVQNIKVVHHLHTLTYMYINTSNAVIFHSSHYFKSRIKLKSWK